MVPARIPRQMTSIAQELCGDVHEDVLGNGHAQDVTSPTADLMRHQRREEGAHKPFPQEAGRCVAICQGGLCAFRHHQVCICSRLQHRPILSLSAGTASCARHRGRERPLQQHRLAARQQTSSQTFWWENIFHFESDTSDTSDTSKYQKCRTSIGSAGHPILKCRIYRKCRTSVT